MYWSGLEDTHKVVESFHPNEVMVNLITSERTQRPADQTVIKCPCVDVVNDLSVKEPVARKPKAKPDVPLTLLFGSIFVFYLVGIFANTTTLL